MLAKIHTATLFACLAALATAATSQTFIVELKEGLNAAALVLNAEDPLMRVIGPYVKEKISIGSFNCLVADLDAKAAAQLTKFAGVKHVALDAQVRLFDLPVEPQGQVLESGLDLLADDQPIRIQIDDTSLIVKGKAGKDFPVPEPVPGPIPDAPLLVYDVAGEDYPEAPVPVSLPDVPVTENPVRVRSVQEDAPIHLARVSERQALGKSESPRSYSYGYTGEGVTAYVIDSGITIEHPEFEGRAIRGANFVKGEQAGDYHGHGTHVAGLIGSKTYGSAKDVTIVEVKALDGRGGGSMSGILQALEWVANDRMSKNAKAVLNMSLGGFYYAILNDATDAVLKSGIAVVVAAGNERSSSSLFSPASAPLAITVGAMDANKDTVAWFSNFGEGVDVFAPGFEVMSLNAKDFDSPVAFSGTSMASPVAAGVVAMYLEEGVTPEEMQAVIKSRSTKKALHKSLRGSWKYYSTPDRVVFSGTDSADTEVASIDSVGEQVDIGSRTVMPSFGQLTQSSVSVNDLTYEIL